MKFFKICKSTDNTSAVYEVYVENHCLNVLSRICFICSCIWKNNYKDLPTISYIASVPNVFEYKRLVSQIFTESHFVRSRS